MLALCGAVLTREVMFLPVAGLAIYFWSRERSQAIAILAAPLLVLASWAWWIRRQLDVPVSTMESSELGLPFVGLGLRPFVSLAPAPWFALGRRLAGLGGGRCSSAAGRGAA